MNPARGLFSVAKLDSIVKIKPRQTFLAHTRWVAGSFRKETGIDRSLALASGSVGVVRDSVGRRLAKIFRSLKRQRESARDFESRVSAERGSASGRQAGLL